PSRAVGSSSSTSSTSRRPKKRGVRSWAPAAANRRGHARSPSPPSPRSQRWRHFTLGPRSGKRSASVCNVEKCWSLGGRPRVGACPVPSRSWGSCGRAWSLITEGNGRATAGLQTGLTLSSLSFRGWGGHAVSEWGLQCL
uniref:Uncharacterized protein n=1 Tax=Tetraodon nigroviridis TaxID=99883 RepID=H3C2V5_TETNG